jgi:dTDP-glucose 4,6-dehydratase
MAKRILITGAAGFLGSHLCDRFLKEGYEVIGMDNLLTGNIKNIEHLFPLKEFQFYHHDVTKFVHVPGNIDYILHFASPASPIDYLKMPIQTLKVGALGTHNLLGFAKAKGARMLVASTSEVYGDPLCIRRPKNTGVM